MKTARIKAFAKLNLFLDIVGVENGYHMLDTVVTTVDLYDSITLSERADDKVILRTGGSIYSVNYMSEVEGNNAYKAAKAFVTEFGTRGVDIVLNKNIPIGSGMGGSSADIAGVLNGMEQIYRTGGDLKAVADKLGSDSGYMLTGGFARLNGRGEIVTPIVSAKKLYFLVVTAEGGVNTSECYAAYDKLSVAPPKTSAETLIDALSVGGKLTGEMFYNALYEPAVYINQKVGEAYEFISSLSPVATLMSGSGSSVFGLFDTPELCLWAQEKARRKFKKTFVLESIVKDEENKGFFFKNPYSL
ncbi:MAG: 4-(cytidine 5'-diphospho)-2-C-methyl-D-erythritol kinase [Clostridia bacterium]|nr:4-(cytidine 5'-diphospho)-2-C-methyl-D-erythritol kinase [Clostridia bacterium]